MNFKLFFYIFFFFVFIFGTISFLLNFFDIDLGKFYAFNSFFYGLIEKPFITITVNSFVCALVYYMIFLIESKR